MGRVEGARAVGRAQREGHRSGFGRAARLAALAAAAVPLLTGCSVAEALRFGWPIGVTPQATHMREFWTWSCIAALVIGAIGAVSVIKAVYVDRRELKCACVGGDSNVPLGFLSLTENVMMVAMALWMIAAPMLSAGH